MLTSMLLSICLSGYSVLGMEIRHRSLHGEFRVYLSGAINADQPEKGGRSWDDEGEMRRRVCTLINIIDI